MTIHGYEAVAAFLLAKRNVILTGDAGCGKSYIVRLFAALPEAAFGVISITALTGVVASTYAGGMTLHHWAGLQPFDICGQDVRKRVLARVRGNQDAVQRIRSTNVLIIDEVSMLNGALLELLDMVCREIRGNQRPMGGILIVAVGDWKQLAPIGHKNLVSDGTSADDNDDHDVAYVDDARQITFADECPLYAFQSSVWTRLDFRVVRLETRHRHLGADPSFFRFMTNVSENQVDEQDTAFACTLERELPVVDIAVHLVGTRREAADINTNQLNKLDGVKTEHTAVDSVSSVVSEARKVIVLSMLNQFAPATISTKVGMPVIATSRIAGVSTGAIGRVIGYTASLDPVVSFEAHGELQVKPHAFELLNVELQVIACREQLPLLPAWALTVHRVQGLTLDAIIIHCDHFFAPGQLYVALTRVRQHSHLQLLGFNTTHRSFKSQVHTTEQRSFGKSLRDTSYHSSREYFRGLLEHIERS